MKAFISWVIATLFFSYQYILRIMPGAMVDEIIVKFNITPSIFGQISGMYYIAYTLAHIPIGMMLDHLGPRKVITFCISMTVLGTLPLIYSDSWVMLSLGRILIGIASSAGVLGVFKVLRMNFPAKKFAFLFGISVTIGYFGAVYAGHPIKYFLETIGMDNTVLSVVLMGIILAIIAFFAISNNSENIKANSNTIFQDLKIVISHKGWLYISLLGGLMIGPMEGFADGWSMKFLSIYYPTIQVTSLAFISSLIFLGLALAAPIVGYITGKINLKSYYVLIMSLGILMLGSFTPIIMFKFGALTLSMLFFILGVTGNFQTLVIIKSTTLVPKELSGLVSACSNMIIMIFGYFFHIIIGSIISTNEGEYSEELFFKALIIIPISIVIALCGLMVLHLRNR